MLEALTVHLGNAHSLTATQICEAVELLTDEHIPAAKKAAFLIALGQKGETPEEIAAFATAMREKSIHPVLDDNWRNSREILDIVGTGGDRLGTFNVSTTAA